MSILQLNVKKAVSSLKDLNNRQNLISSQGYQLINSQVNAKIQKQYIGSDHWEDLSPMQNLDERVESSLDNQYNDAEKDISKLFDLYKSQYVKTKGIINILEKNLYEHDEHITMEAPLFQTLSFQKILVLLREALLMFTQDLVQKKIAMDSINNTTNRNSLLMYTYVWMKGPMLRESILNETFEILENELSV